MSRSALLVALLTVTVGAVAAPAPVAYAQDDDATRRARKHFKRGEKLFALGRFEDALDQYEAAFEAVALPGFLFNIGQCHRNLGDYDSAIFSYRKYLKLNPDAHNRAAVDKLIAELEQKREDDERETRDRKLGLGKPDKPADGGMSRWWYVGGGAAVVAITVGAVLLLADGDGASLPDSDLGNLDFSR